MDDGEDFGDPADLAKALYDDPYPELPTPVDAVVPAPALPSGANITA